MIASPSVAQTTGMDATLWEIIDTKRNVTSLYKSQRFWKGEKPSKTQKIDKMDRKGKKIKREREKPQG